MTHKICFKATTKEIAIVPTASDTPEGFINIGDYTHDTENDPLGAPDSHVLFHHIRDALYQVGVQDMAYINISFTREIESAPVIINCAYPMNASLAEVQAAFSWVDAVPVMTDGSQTATYTLTGSTPTEGWDLVCAPALVAINPTTVDFSSGVKAFEWTYSMPVAATPAPDGDICHMFLDLFYANNLDYGFVSIYIESVVSSNTPVTRLTVERLGSAVSSTIEVPESGRIFVWLDADTGTFSVAHDTFGPIALSDDSYNPATPCIFSANLYESQSAGPSNAGKDIVVSLITDAADMTEFYPEGTTSICGQGGIENEFN